MSNKDQSYKSATPLKYHIVHMPTTNNLYNCYCLLNEELQEWYYHEQLDMMKQVRFTTLHYIECYQDEMPKNKVN